MSRPTLEHLPTEIVHTIMNYLGFTSDREILQDPPDTYFTGNQQTPDQPSWYSLKLQTLVSMCLVSRRLRLIFQPILYQSFMLGYGDSWRSDLYTWNGRLTSFMRTVAERRDLAAFVKRIYIHPYLLESFVGETMIFTSPVRHEIDLRNYPRQYIGENEAVVALRQVAQALEIGLPGASGDKYQRKQKTDRHVVHFEKLLHLSAHDLVSVLIAELPNLERCSLQLGPIDEEIVRPNALCAAGIKQLPITTLDLCLRSSDRVMYENRIFALDRRVGALLAVSPHLETLNLHMCHGFHDSFPALPNLKHLRLSYCRLDEDMLKLMLLSCQGLRSFFYESCHWYYTREQWPLYGEYHFQQSSAIKYLSHHRGTLESIHLDIRRRGFHEHKPEPRDAFSLQGFTALKHVFLTLDEFHSQLMEPSPEGDRELLVQLLPSSIVSLSISGHITEELPRLEESLLGLAEAASCKRELFPKLERVRWEENEKLNEEFAVRARFAAAGVDFDYQSWPTSMTPLGEALPPPKVPNYFLGPINGPSEYPPEIWW